ncbi:MAG TPA: glycosyltransferase family 2 protein [Puia sp.]|nr:glycosyltransferase family 2 protein [Puia sp.]
MQKAVLSVLIPIYNEENTIIPLLERIKQVELIDGFEKELILVDDCSSDKTVLQINEYLTLNPGLNIRLFQHTVNKGKGAALHTAIGQATGGWTIVQDADLEYDPREYNKLLKPAAEGFADVVYGTRFLGGNPHRALFFWHSIGNKFLTFLSNLFTDLNLSDIETGYKLFNTDILKGLRLREQRFGFEPEVTAKVARIPNIRIYEVGISYYGRTQAEGKKIGWKDGFRAIYCILKYNM